MLKKILIVIGVIVLLLIAFILIIAPHSFYADIGLADRYEYWEQSKKEYWGDSLTVNIRYEHVQERAHYRVKLFFNGGTINSQVNKNNIKSMTVNFYDSKGIILRKFEPENMVSNMGDGNARTGITLFGSIYLSKSQFDILGSVSPGYTPRK